MRTCPKCKNSYTSSVERCPLDGQRTFETLHEHSTTGDKLVGASVGSYQITRLLGEGGMGIVYEARHPTLETRVAVKFLQEELTTRAIAVERFFAEARLVSQIGHENVVKVLDFGVLGERPYYIMEFLEGEPLSDLLSREGALPFHKILAIAVQLLDALQTTHARGVIHRDIKPDNVFLLSRAGSVSVKLLDFGIAKLLDGEAPKLGKGLTRSGTMLGTPHYMAPEQLQGQISEIDARTDLYAVGVILYEALCGRRPFPQENLGDYIVAVLTQPVPAPRSLNPLLTEAHEAFLLRALSRERNARFAGAAEMRTALEALSQAERNIAEALTQPSIPILPGTLRDSEPPVAVRALTPSALGEAARLTKFPKQGRAGTRAWLVGVASLGVLGLLLWLMRGALLPDSPRPSAVLGLVPASAAALAPSAALAPPVEEAASASLPQEPTDHERAEALAEQARQHFDRGEYEESLSLLKDAYRLSPDAELLRLLGGCYLKLKDYERAVKTLELFLAQDTNSPFRAAAEQQLQKAKKQLAGQKPSKRPPPKKGPKDLSTLPFDE
jgi:serine/threonine-protein kinase